MFCDTQLKLWRISFVLFLFNLSGCVLLNRAVPQYDGPVVIQPLSQSNVVDVSAEFAGYFCEKAGENCADHFAYHNAVVENQSRNQEMSHFKVLVVPGIFGECIYPDIYPYKYSMDRISEKYPAVDFDFVDSIRGRATSTYNAKQLKHVIDALELKEGQKLIVIGYSKGVTDYLYYLKNHYATSENTINAFVSLSGVVNGTAMADSPVSYLDDLLKKMPNEGCPSQDGSGIESLSLEHQFEWLGNATPIFDFDIPNYSIVTVSDSNSTSTVFGASHQFLSRFGPNDGQVNGSNQIIPKSFLLGYFNADHWAAALPFSDAQESELNTANNGLKRLADKNSFPREALLESLLLYLSDAL